MATMPTRTFPARLDQVPHLWAFAASAVAGMPSDLITRLQLVLEELFVNTVTYGHGGDSEAPVEVTIALDGDHVTLDYADTAPPFNPFAGVESPDATASLEARGVGRLGVFLITHFAERYDYARHAHRNHVSLRLPLR
jgi:anti-sigma regulatory factor (Ser/Thr protein kinase)